MCPSVINPEGKISSSHRCIPENDKYQVCTGGVPCPPCPCPPRSCSPCPCSPCPLSIVHVHHAHVHNVHCPCPLVMSLILTRWRNLVAKFLTNASCATWWPTQPPQGFCEIWENKRWNSGQKGYFRGDLGGGLRPCLYICIVFAFQLIIEVRVRCEEKWR